MLRGSAICLAIASCTVLAPSGCGDFVIFPPNEGPLTRGHEDIGSLGKPYSNSGAPRQQALAGGAPEWKSVGARKWQYIMIHHSATTWGNAAMFHKDHLKNRGWSNGLGYHFVIGNGSNSGDGLIEVGPRWIRQIAGAHAGVRLYNDHGIGVCLVGDLQRGRATARQMQSLARLVRYLQARYDVPAERVIGHRDVKVTNCPGRNFSVPAFRERLLTSSQLAATGPGVAPLN